MSDPLELRAFVAQVGGDTAQRQRAALLADRNRVRLDAATELSMLRRLRRDFQTVRETAERAIDPASVSIARDRLREALDRATGRSES